MSRSAPIRFVFASFALLGAAGWWGCAKPTGTSSTQLTGAGGTVTGTTSTGGGGAGGAGDAGTDAGPACVPTSVAAHYVPVDMLFVLDQSTAMHGTDWTAITTDLTTFFKDPVSAGIGAGLLLFPYSAYDCNLEHYEIPTVPIGALPGNAALLTGAFPADSLGYGAPTYPALQGALQQATARQDAAPTHKIMVVLATDEDPNVCDAVVSDVAGLSASALNYNGVRTYVIALPGASVADLDKIAAAGGTVTTYDVTIDITQLPTSLAKLRTAALGCDFAIPAPPNNKPLDPNEVNFSYTAKGTGQPVVLPRSQDLAGCNGQPGWYYDSNAAPTKIVLCPTTCATVQADTSAVVDVLFGCTSFTN
jgi:hypothetical protein